MCDHIDGIASGVVLSPTPLRIHFRLLVMQLLVVRICPIRVETASFHFPVSATCKSLTTVAVISGLIGLHRALCVVPQQKNLLKVSESQIVGGSMPSRSLLNRAPPECCRCFPVWLADSAPVSIAYPTPAPAPMQVPSYSGHFVNQPILGTPPIAAFHAIQRKAGCRFNAAFRERVRSGTWDHQPKIGDWAAYVRHDWPRTASYARTGGA